MNLKRALIVVFALATAFCFVALVGARANRVESGWVWTWGIGMVLFACLMVWALFLRDKTPDVLAELGLNYFERKGLCFAFVPGVENERLMLNVIYQNRYNSPCTGEIVLRLAADKAETERESLIVCIRCEAAGVGKYAVPWDVAPEFVGRRATCLLGAEVDYPQGRGLLLRSGEGIQVGSIEEVNTPELLQVLMASPAKFEFTIPQFNPAAAAPPIRKSTEPVSPDSPAPAPSAAVKLEFTVSGNRLVKVVCEKCGHSYEYTLDRKVTAAGEDPNADVAKEKAEAAARQQLDKLLAEECDVVACPQCGALTERMKKQKLNNRGKGLLMMLAGCGLTLLGAGICWGAYALWGETKHFSIMCGILGVCFVGLGLFAVPIGLLLLFTGGAMAPSNRHPTEDRTEHKRVSS